MLAINSQYERFDTGYPVFLRVVELKQLKLISASTAMSKPRDGPLHWHHNLQTKEVEPGVYALVGAPTADTAKSGRYSEVQARSALVSFTALLSVLYGTASFHSMKCELLIDCRKDSYSFVSPVIENPAFFTIDHFKDVPLTNAFEISKRIESSDGSVRLLINVALSFVNRAISETSAGIKLSLYFSAIDVLAGDVSKNNVCTLLDVSHKELDELGFSELVQKRNDFVHHGKIVNLQRNEERILQYLLLDLICGRIGLRSPRYSKDYYAALLSHLK